MAEKNVPQLYLACQTEDTSNATIHQNIAASAESLGAVVLNRWRSEVGRVAHKKKGDWFTEDLNESIPLMKKATAFAGFLGMRNFWSGVELGNLLGLGIPGVLFTDSRGIQAQFSSLFPDLNVTHLSSQEDTKKISAAIRDLLNPSSQELFFRTGSLALDWEYKRLLYGVKHVQLEQAEYHVLSLLAKEAGEFVHRDEIREYCQVQLNRVDISDTNMNSYLGHTTFKVNHLDRSRRYIDVQHRKYRLHMFPPDSNKLPELADVGPLHVDFTNDKVWFNKEDPNLGRSGTAFTLVLARNLNQLLTKAEVMDQVWPGREIHPSMYTDQLIRLKKKFGEANKDPQGLIIHERGKVAMVTPLQVA